jgi:hypothetical protein
MTQNESAEHGAEAGAQAPTATPATPRLGTGLTRLRAAGLSVLTIAGGALVYEPISLMITSYFNDMRAEQTELARQKELAHQRALEEERREAEAARLAEEKMRTDKVVAVSEATVRSLDQLVKEFAARSMPTPTATAPAPQPPAPQAHRSEPPVAGPRQPEPQQPVAPRITERAAPAMPQADRTAVTTIAVRRLPLVLPEQTGTDAPPPAREKAAEPPARTPRAETLTQEQATKPAAPLRLFTVLGTDPFSLCGHANFTAEASAAGLLLANTDRDFAYRVGFRRWEKRVSMDAPNEVFPGCFAKFQRQTHYGSVSLLVQEFKGQSGE